MVVGSPICVYAFYAVSDFLKEKVTMHEDWKKVLEDFQEHEFVFQKKLVELQKELVELQKELPKKSELIESMSILVSLNMKSYKNIVEQMVEHLKEFKFSRNYNLKMLNTEEQIQILYLYDLMKNLLQSKGEFYEMKTVFNKEINLP